MAETDTNVNSYMEQFTNADTVIPENGVRLLSLDGGGIKGISTLIVLDAIMTQIKEIEIERGISTSEEERLPRDYFELAAGTSTGGLIALMLFRLNMSVSKTMEQYEKMAAKVFSPTAFGFSLHRLGAFGDWLGEGVLVFKTLFEKAQFSDGPLKETIAAVVTEFGIDKEDRASGGDAPLVHPQAGNM
jgi:patatin-like phospholipase/acyl hydrolase